MIFRLKTFTKKLTVRLTSVLVIAVLIKPYPCLYPRTDPLNRGVLLTLPKEIELDPNDLIKVLKTMHGFHDYSSEYWVKRANIILYMIWECNERFLTTLIMSICRNRIEDCNHVGERDYCKLGGKPERKFHCEEGHSNSTQLCWSIYRWTSIKIDHS